MYESLMSQERRSPNKIAVKTGNSTGTLGLGHGTRMQFFHTAVLESAPGTEKAVLRFASSETSRIIPEVWVSLPAETMDVLAREWLAMRQEQG